MSRTGRFFTAGGCVHPIRHAPGYVDAKARGHCSRCADKPRQTAAHDDGADETTMAPGRLADRLGYTRTETGPPTDAEVTEAERHHVPAIKREIRAAAAAALDDHQRWLDEVQGARGHLRRPPDLERALNYGSGRVESRSHTAQDYDWFTALPDVDKDWLRGNTGGRGKGWFAAAGDTAASGVDELAQRIAAHTAGIETDSDALALWVKEARIVDGLTRMAAGRPPSRTGGGLDAGDLLDSPYNLTAILSEPRAAAREVAEVNKTEGADISRRQLGHPRHGPAPWEMTQTAYVEELTRAEAHAGVDVDPVDDEWGPVRTKEQTSAERRLAELVPAGFDDPAAPLPAATLYRAILKTARQIGIA